MSEKNDGIGIELAGKQILFESDAPEINLHLSRLLQDWLAAGGAGTGQPADIKITLKLVDAVLKPAGQSLSEHGRDRPDAADYLSLYQSKNDWLLHFHGAGLFQLPRKMLHLPAGLSISGRVTLPALSSGRLIDMLFTVLSAWYRRQRIYMTHAFAANYEGQALLITGPSGSGKTTSGLKLITNGWSFLANDLVMMQELDGLVQALPTPGGFTLAPSAGPLLPALAHLLKADAPAGIDGKIYIPEREIIAAWSTAAPIKVIVFPTIAPGPSSQLTSLSRAVTLARLMEASLDRWDEAGQEQHVRFLQQLSGQAAGYRLHLGGDANSIPELLEELIAL